MNLCDARWEPRFVDFFGGETRTPGYRAINELGEVPVLEHHGKRLSQSGVILDYLASTFATLRYMVTLAKFGEPQVHDFLRGRVKTSLGILDQHLSKFGASWSDYPRVGAGLERIRALPGWAHPYELMPGHPLKR